jgi:cytochrome c-type biogenesis protein CcmE
MVKKKKEEEEKNNIDEEEESFKKGKRSSSGTTRRKAEPKKNSKTTKKGNNRTGSRKEPNRKKKKMGKKTKFLIAIIIIVIVIIIGIGGMSGAEDYMTVGDVIDEESKYMNKYVEVRGTVKDESWDTVNSTFILTDGESDMLINYTDLLPSNFQEGKDVVVKGTVRKNIVMEIQVKEIEVGCPSKY